MTNPEFSPDIVGNPELQPERKIVNVWHSLIDIHGQVLKDRIIQEVFLNPDIKFIVFFGEPASGKTSAASACLIDLQSTAKVLGEDITTSLTLFDNHYTHYLKERSSNIKDPFFWQEFNLYFLETVYTLQQSAQDKRHIQVIELPGHHYLNVGKETLDELVKDRGTIAIGIPQDPQVAITAQLKRLLATKKEDPCHIEEKLLSEKYKTIVRWKNAPKNPYQRGIIVYEVLGRMANPNIIVDCSNAINEFVNKKVLPSNFYPTSQDILNFDELNDSLMAFTKKEMQQLSADIECSLRADKEELFACLTRIKQAPKLQLGELHAYLSKLAYIVYRVKELQVIAGDCGGAPNNIHIGINLHHDAYVEMFLDGNDWKQFLKSKKSDSR